MLQSDLCDYSDAYIVKGTITVQTENNRAINGYNRNLILKIMPNILHAYRKSIMYKSITQKI